MNDVRDQQRNANDLHHQHHRREEIPELDFEKLEVVTALGRGAKGVVFLARNATENDGEWLALKVISRALIERKATVVSADGSEYRRVCFEREVLRLFRHPLLPRLRGVLDTQKVVGYAIDYCAGRDLNTLRKKQTEKMFSDDAIRYFVVWLVFLPFLIDRSLFQFLDRFEIFVSIAKILRCGISYGVGVCTQLRNSLQRFEAGERHGSTERPCDACRF